MTLLERGAGHLAGYAAGDGPTYGLDLAALVSCVRERAAEVGQP